MNGKETELSEPTAVIDWSVLVPDSFIPASVIKLLAEQPEGANTQGGIVWDGTLTAPATKA